MPPVAAEVIGCGHLAHSDLADIVWVQKAPQIHLHLLTSEEDFLQRNDGRIEFCCHGCGTSLLLLYDSEVNVEHRVKLPFIAEHARCPNYGFDTWCFDFRSKFFTLDLRGQRPAQRGDKLATE